MRITLNGFSKKWDVFFQVINGQQYLLGWDCLWRNFIMEEIRLSLVGGNNKGQKGENDENVPIAGKGKPKKG